MLTKHYAVERGPVRHQRNQKTHQAGERDAVQQDEAEDGAFGTVGVGGCGGYDDALWRDHLAHHTAGRVRRCH